MFIVAYFSLFHLSVNRRFIPYFYTHASIVAQKIARKREMNFPLFRATLATETENGGTSI